MLLVTLWKKVRQVLKAAHHADMKETGFATTTTTFVACRIRGSRFNQLATKLRLVANCDDDDYFNLRGTPDHASTSPNGAEMPSLDTAWVLGLSGSHLRGVLHDARARDDLGGRREGCGRCAAA
jgi:hypothetical protein